MKKAEFYIALFLCALAVFIFFTSNTIPLMRAVEKHSIVNARFFPKLMSIILIVLSLTMVLVNVFKRSPKPYTNDAAGQPDETGEKSWIRLLLIIVLSVAYFFGLNTLGFLIASALYMLLFLLILGTRKWYVLVSLTAAIPISVYVIFKILLSIPLPRGILYF